MQGFFPASKLVSKAPASLIPKCGACGLHKTCQSPKMPPSGRGKRRVLLVGEAPGKNEDIQNKQFVGKTGRLLEDTLNRIGVNMRRDCWITNALICRPENNKIEDENRIDYCRPNLIRTLNELKPDVVILLGLVPTKSLISWLWKDKVESLGPWTGWQIPSQRLNAWICPTWHPSFIERNTQMSQFKKENEVLTMFWERQLRAAFELEDKPWKTIPDYKSKVEVIRNPSKAAKIIYEEMDNCGVAAFDYETNMLKPDWEDRRIVCCSICFDGKRTIAYPWHKEAIKATRKFLRSDILKIASNMKFEDRWTQREFGFWVKNFEWDTMLAAHTLDNREGTTGLKFQSFVRFGMEPYDDHISPYLRTKGSRKVNQILKEVDLDDLLLYCGLDSLLEYKLAMVQHKEIGLIRGRN